MSLYVSLTKPTSDGGYIMTGECYSLITNEDAFLIKLNSLGDTVWTKKYPDVGSSSGSDVIETNDGGFLLVTGASVIKTDSIGQPLWSKSFNSQGSNYVSCAMESTNGDLVIAGYASFLLPAHREILIVKLDNSGNMLFAKSFGGFKTFNPSAIYSTIDNGYIISGSSDYYYQDGDGLLIKTDSLGNPLWIHKYGSNQTDAFFYSTQLNDGNYMAIGHTVSNNGIFLVKADSSGSLLWAKTYKLQYPASYNLGYMINKTTDNNLVFCGRTSGEEAVIFKIDTSGSVIWVKGFKPVATSANACFNSVFETPDMGFILSGYFVPNSINGYLYLVKTDSTGNNNCFINTYPVFINSLVSKDSSYTYPINNFNISNLIQSSECFCDTSNTLCVGTGLNVIYSVASLKVSPNPFGNKLDINVENQIPHQIIIYDISGRNVLEVEFTKSITLNTEQLAKGLYLYEVRNRNGLCKNGKVVKD